MAMQFKRSDIRSVEKKVVDLKQTLANASKLVIKAHASWPHGLVY